VWPAGGSTAGGTVLTVLGRGFDGAAGVARCRFGGSGGAAIGATVDTSTQLRCVTPAAAGAGGADVQVSVNYGGTSPYFTSDAVPFFYAAPATVSAVVPTRGPSTGGTRVTVHGTNMLAWPHTVCRFADADAQALYTRNVHGRAPGADAGADAGAAAAAVGGQAATFVTSTTVVCVAPPRSRGTALVLVSTNNADYAAATAGAVFVYDDEVRPASVTPAFGPEVGGTLVTVTASAFPSATSAWCRFDRGGAVVAATVASSTAVTCRTPAHAPGTVQVAVSANNADFSESVALLFEFEPWSAVARLVPASGPTSGGTRVTVHGADLQLGAARCKFGALVATQATYVTSTMCVCASPAQAAGAVSVEISSNGDDYTALTHQFTYYVPPTVVSVRPTFGPAHGGTLLTIQGTRFLRQAALVCRFGTTERRVATWQETTQLLVRSPQMTLPTTVAVECSNNNQDFTAGGAAVYEFQRDHNVTGFNQTRGPALGYTELVVYGREFVSTAWLRCSFGVLRPVVATFLTTTSVYCVTPAHAAAYEAVEVSLNAVDYTIDAQQFWFQPDIEIVRAYPPRGPTLGGTLVTVWGHEFQAQGSVTCAFGTLLRTPSSAATVLSSTLLTCLSPAQPVGDYALELSNNGGQDLTTLRVMYSYYTPETVSEIDPTVGSVLGGTRVTVYGTFMRDIDLDLHCKWGASSPVRATIVSSVYAVCVSPAHAAGTVNLEVSNNNQVRACACVCVCVCVCVLRCVCVCVCVCSAGLMRRARARRSNTRRAGACTRSSRSRRWRASATCAGRRWAARRSP
jgi:hypothetical protein